MNYNLSTCAFEVHWNNNNVFFAAGSDYSIHTEILIIEAVGGNNLISFIEVGIQDGIGMGLDNVELYTYDDGNWEVINTTNGEICQCQ